METLLKIVQTINSYLSDYILIVMLVAAGPDKAPLHIRKT